MSKQYYWKPEGQVEALPCKGKKEVLKLLYEKGGKAWSAFLENGRFRIHDIKIDLFGKEIK